MNDIHVLCDNDIDAYLQVKLVQQNKNDNYISFRGSSLIQTAQDKAIHTNFSVLL